MHLKTLFHCSVVADRLRFLSRCLGQRELLQWLMDDRKFAQQLFDSRDTVKTYFTSKWDFAKMAFNEGTIFEEEQPLLRELVEASNSLPGPIVEIGTLFGSTTTLLALWKAPHKKIITVDNYSWNPWQLSPLVHRALTDRSLHYLSAKGEVEIVSQDKQEFFDGYAGEPPSLVFLDADHEYEATRADIQWAKRAGAKIICGHDYAAHCPGVGRAVEEEGGAARHSHGLWALNNGFFRQGAAECRRSAA